MVTIQNCEIKNYEIVREKKSKFYKFNSIFRLSRTKITKQ